MSEKTIGIMVGCGQVASVAQVESLASAVMSVLEARCDEKTKREALSVLKNGLKADGKAEANSFSNITVSMVPKNE